MTQSSINKTTYNKQEYLSRDELTSLQLHRLQEQISRVANTPFYKKKLPNKNNTYPEINTLDDIKKLPFTSKEDLRAHYPLGFLAIPKSDVARFHGSSGTTGKPTFVAYSQKDLNTWANLCARFLYAGGVRSQHTAQVAFGYGLFTGGFGLHYGLEKLGASVIPVSSGNTPRQLMIMQDMAADILICTPSYALNIAEVAKSQGIDPVSLPIKYGHFGGEMWTEDMRIKIEEELGIKAYNNYGLSEVIGPGIAGECQLQNGMHVQEDHFFVECIDPETLEAVPDGTPGELVFTSLTKEAMPILRYRTRDIATLSKEQCSCGRTTIKMGRVIGRSDDMFIIKGVNVYPSQIEEALLRVEGTAPHYIIEIDRPTNLDQVTVKVEVRSTEFSDKMSEMQELKEKIDREVQSVANIRANIELVAPQTIERSCGKAIRVIDNRHK